MAWVFGVGNTDKLDNTEMSRMPRTVKTHNRT